MVVSDGVRLLEVGIERFRKPQVGGSIPLVGSSVFKHFALLCTERPSRRSRFHSRLEMGPSLPNHPGQYFSPVRFWPPGPPSGAQIQRSGALCLCQRTRAFRFPVANETGSSARTASPAWSRCATVPLVVLNVCPVDRYPALG